MKSSVQDLVKKPLKDLVKEITKLREEITKLLMDMKANPPKDTNAVAKKRRKLATLLTVFNSKKAQEAK